MDGKIYDVVVVGNVIVQYYCVWSWGKRTSIVNY